MNNVANVWGQIYYQNSYIYGLKTNSFKDNKADGFSKKVFSYPYRFRLNLKHLIGKQQMVEDQHTLYDFPPNLQKIKLEFVFYDEMDEQINLDQYITQKKDFVQIVTIESIKTVKYQGPESKRYHQKNATQLNKNSFIDSNLITLGKTWINDNLEIKASPLSSVILIFKTKIIRRFDIVQRKVVKNRIFNLTINFRKCQSGEYYNKKENYCQICQNGTFSFRSE